jgi:hypothetical protein
MTMLRGLDRLRIFNRMLVVLAAGLAAAGCSAKTVGEARYGAEDCRRVALLDVATGNSIRGVEDLALDPARDRLYVAAYDRRGVERAVRRKEFSIPEGGVYTVSLSGLVDGRDTAPATAFVRREDIAGGLRPHGISYNAEIGEIAFINRGYQRLNGRWKMIPRVERIGVRGEIIVGKEAATPCAANDLLDEPRLSMISFDHEHCDWRAGLEDAFSLRRSGVVDEDGAPLYDRALYANGIARTADGGIALAATREKAVLLMDERAGGLTLSRRIALPGGPDNLTLATDGAIIAAVHPSLFLMGLHRRLGFAAAPSRIVKADPATNSVEVLFDDPEGALFSAATVGAEWNGALIAGSVTDDGLLVCKAAG